MDRYQLEKQNDDQVKSYDTNKIIVETSNELDLITFVNVTYVFLFMSNVVSNHLLKMKGVFLDDWKKHIHREGKTIVNVQSIKITIFWRIMFKSHVR